MNEIEWDDAIVIKVAKVNNFDRNCHFVAKSDGKIWKDDHPTGAIDAAYYGEDKYDMAKRIDHDYNLEFYDLDIVGSFTSRLSGSNRSYFGDTPGESVSYIEFPKTQSVDHNITDADTIEQQIIDILNEKGTTHYVDILDNYIVEDKLDDDIPDYDKFKQKLESMSEDTKIYVPSGRNRTWWNIK